MKTQLYKKIILKYSSSSSIIAVLKRLIIFHFIDRSFSFNFFIEAFKLLCFSVALYQQMALIIKIIENHTYVYFN